MQTLNVRSELTSLHKSHPGRRTAMTTAPDFSHRVLALKVLVSAQISGERLTGAAYTNVVLRVNAATHLLTEF